MSQLLVHSEPVTAQHPEGAAHDRRAHEHACEFARQHRAHRGACRRVSARARGARPCGGRCEAAGRPRAGRHTRGVFGRQAERRGDRVYRRVGGTGNSAAAAGLDPAGFCRDRIRRAVDGGPRRTRPRSARRGDRARRRRRRSTSHRRRCAGLRCAGRGGAGSLGRSPSVRSRRQPQADVGGAGLRRHRPVAAGGGAAAALDGGNALDRARGAFAAGLGRECVGRADGRRATRPQSSWPGRAVDHGMEM